MENHRKIKGEPLPADCCRPPPFTWQKPQRKRSTMIFNWTNKISRQAIPWFPEHLESEALENQHSFTQLFPLCIKVKRQPGRKGQTCEECSSRAALCRGLAQWLCQAVAACATRLTLALPPSLALLSHEDRDKRREIKRMGNKPNQSPALITKGTETFLLYHIPQAGREPRIFITTFQREGDEEEKIFHKSIIKAPNQDALLYN